MVIKPNEKSALRKLQKVIIIYGRYRFAFQLLQGISDTKNKPHVSLRKLSFLFNVIYSLKLHYNNKPPILIEAVNEKEKL